MRLLRALFFILVAIFGCSEAMAPVGDLPQPQIAFAPRHYVCYRALSSVIVDGRVQESSWQLVPWTEAFVDIEGDLKPAPKYLTHAKMVWDDTYFYIAAELQDADVWATLTQRDTIIFYDNDFEVFIDPDGDTHQYYELEINAFNTVWDLLLIKPYRDGGPAVHAWDVAGLKTAVTIQGSLNHAGDVDQGWTVEMALPWPILKECAHTPTPPKFGDQWRVNFSRVQWPLETRDGAYRKKIDPNTGKPFAEQNWVWSPQGLINMHYPEMWGYVQFSGKPAGESESFSPHPDEAVKWQLRQLYYAQRSYYQTNERYAQNLEALSLTLPPLPGFLWPPQMFATDTMFEARIFSQKRDRSWFIREDGRVLPQWHQK